MINLITSNEGMQLLSCNYYNSYREQLISSITSWIASNRLNFKRQYNIIVKGGQLAIGIKHVYIHSCM